MNTFIVVGRLCKDSVLRYVADGTPVLGFTIASDVGYGKNKHPIFVDASMWGKRGEAIEAYLKKGKEVTVSGEADLRVWESNGKNGANITMRVNEVAMHGGNTSTEGSQSSEPEQAQTGFRRDATKPIEGGFEDDDIPF